MALKIYRSGSLVSHERTTSGIDNRYGLQPEIEYYWPIERIYYTKKNDLFSFYRVSGSTDFTIVSDLSFAEIIDGNNNDFASIDDLYQYLQNLFSSDTTNSVSSSNSSNAAINSGESFTGDWEDVSGFNSLIVAVNTDQDGIFILQFSPDGVNIDSTLTRYYRTSQIEPPHRFTITRQFFRLIFTNESTTNQSFFRLQTTYGNKENLNIPLDSRMSQDYDAIAVRPTDPSIEVALGLRQGANLWNKFGYNEDVDSATSEIIASFGGAFNQKLTNAEILNISSSSINDTSGGTGVRSLVIFGVGGASADSREEITDVVTLNGTSIVTSNLRFWGINRMTIFQSGSADSNVGNITATASTSGNTMAEMPAGEGTTQQILFYVPANYQFLTRWLYLSVIKSSGGGNPEVTFKGFVYSEIVESKFEIYRDTIDLSANNGDKIQLTPVDPFVVGEASILWFEASTTTNNTSVKGRFSGQLWRNVDA